MRPAWRTEDAGAGWSLLQRRLDRARATARRLSGLSPPMLGLVAACVATEVSKGLLANWEQEAKASLGVPRPWVALMVFAKDLLSLAAGLALAAARGGARGLWEAADPQRVLRLLPIAATFASAQVFGLLALKQFDAGSVKVTSQLSLPATAALSWALLGRRYSVTQWQAIMFLVLCSAAFIEVRILFETGAPSPLELLLGQTRRRRHCQGGAACEIGLSESFFPGGELEGLTYLLLSVLLGSTASVLTERALKGDKRPFHQQKCSFVAGESLATLGMLAAGALSFGSGPGPGSAWAPEGGLLSLEGWDWRSWAVVVAWAVHGWVAGMTAKRISALAKSIAHVLAATVSYAVATALWPRAPFYPRGILATMAAAQVLLGVLIFATVPAQKEAVGKQGGAAPPKGRSSFPASIFALAAALSSASQATPVCLPVQLRVKAACRLLVSKLALFCLGPPGMLAMFILLEAVRPVLVSWAQQGHGSARAFSNGSFVLGQTLVSFCVALALGALAERSAARAFRLCASPVSVICRLPVACCFTASKLALLVALARLDAGTVRVIAQGGLPMVALGSAMLGKRYSLLQWEAIWMIGLGVITFFLVKTETERHASEYPLWGRPWPPKEGAAHHEQPGDARTVRDTHVALFYVFMSLGANCFGALISERFLHSTSACTPCYVQKAHLLGGECLVNLFVCLCSWLASPTESFFEHFVLGWDHRTVITMLVWIPSGWCATLVVRHCSALSKNIAQSASSLLTYIFSVRPPPTLLRPALEAQPVVAPVFLLAAVCLQSVVLFVVATAAEQAARRQRGGSKAEGPQASPFRERRPSPCAPRSPPPPLPVLAVLGHDEVWPGLRDSPLCQIDNHLNAGLYSPMRRSHGLGPLLPGPGGPSRLAVAEPGLPGRAREGLGLARVSTLGNALCDLAGDDGQPAAGAARVAGAAALNDDTLGDRPIGQTDCIWAAGLGS